VTTFREIGARDVLEANSGQEVKLISNKFCLERGMNTYKCKIKALTLNWEWVP
jgi:hypothetical protein